jgi:hypothetical protein
VRAIALCFLCVVSDNNNLTDKYMSQTLSKNHREAFRFRVVSARNFLQTKNPQEDTEKGTFEGYVVAGTTQLLILKIPPKTNVHFFQACLLGFKCKEV